MHRSISLAAWLLLSTAAACGARTSLVDDGVDDGPSVSVGGGAAPSGSAGGGTPASGSGASTGSGGDPSCTPGSAFEPGGRAARVEALGDEFYFTQDDGRVLRASSLDGGLDRVLDGLSEPGDIAIFGGRLYASDATRLQSIPLQYGPAPNVLYEGPDAAAAFLEVDETGAYWMSIRGGVLAATLWRLRPGETAPTALVDDIDQPGGLALVGDDVLFSAMIVPAASSEDLGLIVRVPKAGGAPTIVTSAPEYPGAVLPLGDRIGWLETFSATRAPLGVYAQPFDASEPASVLLAAPTEELPITARVLGDHTVYMTTYHAGGGAIYRGAVGQPAPVSIAREEEFFIEPAIGDRFVGWTVSAVDQGTETFDLRWACR
jgi:hypothetical protein